MVHIEDIAARAGVSRWTVSRVLNDPQMQYARPTLARRAERIRILAAELGYLPNAGAKAAASGRFHAVALLTRRHIDKAQLNVTKGVYEGLYQSNLHMHYAHVPDEDRLDVCNGPRLLKELCVDGLIVHYSQDVPVPVVRSLRNYRAPAVWINTDGTEDCVRPDDRQGAELATQSLLELGHRHIAYLDVARGHHSMVNRHEGYVRTMADAGVPHRVIQTNDLPPASSLTDQIERWRQMLDGHDRPSACICVSRAHVESLILAAASKGLRIPRDLSLVLFNNGTRAALAEVDISTMNIPLIECGRTAAQMIVQKIENPSQPLPSRGIEYERPERFTIAPPAQTASHQTSNAGPSRT
jgi:DNA-binding LacI/PurR family transcriptional regulator